MAVEKHVRSVRIDPVVYERLNKVCEHLGVSANAFIINAVGEAVSRAEVNMLALRSQTEMMQQFMEIMEKGMKDANG